ncbi:MAG: peptidoglycan binding protein CsiV [Sedimenticola sp.]|nr:peptidoglycan binding protein CsiV [Sedimenticola sp.]
MKKPAQLLFSLLAILIALPQLVSAENEQTWYDIELILYKQGSSYSAKSEHWPTDPGSPDWSEAVNLVPEASGKQQPYALLPRPDWRLTAAFNALRNTRGELEPLFHQAWRQPVAGPKNAKPIYLGSPTGLFEGVIKISVNRYLHVDLDLLLKNALGNTLPATSSEDALSPSLGSVRVTGKRRMRSGEIHYIDHPMMGALILISRIEVTTPEPVPTATVESAADASATPSEAATQPAEPPAAN